MHAMPNLGTPNHRCKLVDQEILHVCIHLDVPKLSSCLSQFARLGFGKLIDKGSGALVQALLKLKRELHL